MKKLSQLLVALLFCCIVYLGYIKYCQSNAVAEYIYDTTGYYDVIKFNGKVYEPITFVSKPYELVFKADSDGGDLYYIARNNFDDLLLPWDRFVFYSSDYDNIGAFIRVFPYDNLYVVKDFVYPTINKNKISEIWMSCSSSYEIIKNKLWVNQIVESAKSKGQKGIDKEVYDYIVSNSWDNHCIYLKYEGYPLVEEFYVTETEDGRYIVDQYTAEEYDTIFYEEH